MKYYTLAQIAKKFKVPLCRVLKRVQSGEIKTIKLKPKDRKHTFFVKDEIVDNFPKGFFDLAKKVKDPDKLYEKGN